MPNGIKKSTQAVTEDKLHQFQQSLKKTIHIDSITLQKWPNCRKDASRQST
jgi:hypothetical protein